MVEVYCNYGLYNEDSAHSIDEGDIADELSYFDDGNRIVVENVRLKSITKERVILELPDGCETILNIEDIEDWR